LYCLHSNRRMNATMNAKKQNYRIPPDIPHITVGHSLLIEYVTGGIMSPQAQATRAYASREGKKFAIRSVGIDGIIITRTK
jgi:hypothetical protein